MLFRCELSALSRCEYLNEPEWRFSFYARLQKPSRCDLLPEEFLATDAAKNTRKERYGFLRCERCAFVAGAARNNSAPHEKISRYGRCEKYTQRTLRVLTLR